MNDIASIAWLTPEHKAAHAAEGTRSMIAAPLHHGGEVIGTLVFYSRRARTFGAGGRSRRERRREPRGGGDRGGVRLPEAGAPRRDPAAARRGERASSRRRSTTRRRSRTSRSSSFRSSPTGASSTSSGRTGEIQRLAVAHEDPAKVERAQALIEKLPIEPGRAAGRSGGHPDTAARVAAGDRGRADRGGFPRPSRRARGAARARPPELDDRPARRAPARARGDHVRRVRVGRTLRRGGSRDRARPRAAGGGGGRQRRPLPRGAAQGEPGQVPRRGRQRA